MNDFNKRLNEHKKIHDAFNRIEDQRIEMQWEKLNPKSFKRFKKLRDELNKVQSDLDKVKGDLDK